MIALVGGRLPVGHSCVQLAVSNRVDKRLPHLKRACAIWVGRLKTKGARLGEHCDPQQRRSICRPNPRSHRMPHPSRSVILPCSGCRPRQRSVRRALQRRCPAACVAADNRRASRGQSEQPQPGRKPAASACGASSAITPGGKAVGGARAAGPEHTVRRPPRRDGRATGRSSGGRRQRCDSSAGDGGGGGTGYTAAQHARRPGRRTHDGERRGGKQQGATACSPQAGRAAAAAAATAARGARAGGRKPPGGRSHQQGQPAWAGRGRAAAPVARRGGHQHGPPHLGGGGQAAGCARRRELA